MRSILTSSQSLQPGPESPSQISWCLQETAFSQRIEMPREGIARTPPPAFLFPINDVKDPTAAPKDVADPLAGGAAPWLASEPFESQCLDGLYLGAPFHSARCKASHPGGRVSSPPTGAGVEDRDRNSLPGNQAAWPLDPAGEVRHGRRYLWRPRSLVKRVIIDNSVRRRPSPVHQKRPLRPGRRLWKWP